MMSSCGNWRMSSRTTVRPPIPESNTPMGASDCMCVGICVKDRSKCERGTNGGAVRGWGHRDVGLEVPEIRGDIGISAGNYVIEYQSRNPVFIMRSTRTDARDEPVLRVTGRSDHTRDRVSREARRNAVLSRGARLAQIECGLPRHADREHLSHSKENRRRGTIEARLSETGKKHRINHRTTRRDRRMLQRVGDRVCKDRRAANSDWLRALCKHGRSDKQRHERCKAHATRACHSSTMTHYRSRVACSAHELADAVAHVSG